MSEDPLLGELLSDTRRVVRQLLDEPLGQPEFLRIELDEWSARHLRDDGLSLADLTVALSLQRGCLELLEAWPDLDRRGRQLVQVAVRYFVLDEDGDDDLDSPFGFDDDLEVFNAVCGALGREPLPLG